MLQCCVRVLWHYRSLTSAAVPRNRKLKPVSVPYSGWTSSVIRTSLPGSSDVDVDSQRHRQQKPDEPGLLLCFSYPSALKASALTRFVREGRADEMALGWHGRARAPSRLVSSAFHPHLQAFARISISARFRRDETAATAGFGS
jgi:hypothetical protein